MVLRCITLYVVASKFVTLCWLGTTTNGVHTNLLTKDLTLAIIFINFTVT